MTSRTEKAERTVFIGLDLGGRDQSAVQIHGLVGQPDLVLINGHCYVPASDVGNAAPATVAIPRPLEEWHEDDGFVTWWKFPVDEPSWIGSPLCSDWPGYHTHWTPHPPIPAHSLDQEATNSTSGEDGSVGP